MTAEPGFAALGLAPPLLQSLGAAGYETPSPLQQACVPALLAGRDVVAQGYAGSGKTLSFVLPLLERLDVSLRAPQYLVLTPSYSLSVEVAQQFVALARHLPGFHVLPIHGGEGQVIQLRQLERGAHVVIGSPRWILGHVDSGRLSLGQIRTAVIDEADELLRMGFQDVLQTLLAGLPATCQWAIYAAEWNRPLEKLMAGLLHAPMWLRLPEASIAAPLLRQRFWQIDSARKLDALLRLIEIEPRFDAALVFVHTRGTAKQVTEQLLARGYAATVVDAVTSVDAMHSKIEALVGGTFDILVATDGALPELRFGRITHVIHYDLPCDARSYGMRLGHSPAVGHSLLLVTASEKPLLHAIERAIGATIEPLVLPERPREH